MTASQTCFWCPWQFWGVLVRYFVGRPPIGICLIFFSWLDRGLWIWGGGSQRPSSIFITAYQGYILSTWFMTVVDLNHLAYIVSVSFLQWKVTFFPLSTWHSLEGSHFRQPIRKEWGLYRPSFMMEDLIIYLEFVWMGNLSSPQFINLFNNLFISVWTYGYSF